MTFMRPVLVASLLLLQSLAAFAQPVMSDEVVSDPIPLRNPLLTIAVPAVSLAHDQVGVAMAWTMRNAAGVDRIYVTRLDAGGHVRGSIREVPRSWADYDSVSAAYPSLAPSAGGSGFVLAWIELPLVPSATTRRAVYCRLDAQMNPSAPAVVTELSDQNTPTPILARTAKETWLTVAGSVWQLRRDGSLDARIVSGLLASDMAATSDYPRLVSSRPVQSGFTCMAQAGCRVGGGPFNGYCYDRCRIPQFSYAVQLVALFSKSSEVTFTFGSDAQPAVQSDDGRGLMIAWFSGQQVSGGQVVAARLDALDDITFHERLAHPDVLGFFGGDIGPTRPDIATDGERSLIVWRTRAASGDHNVVGASIDGAGRITPLVIADSAADERDPSVIATGADTFLVAYEKLEVNGERRIAGRFISFAGRKRAVR
jgi:hypothetical protein